ncbi:hypothetical protein IGL98_002974 [Enterococcus sp. DIV0840]|uniref:MerR family transcriptional regulator n=1 Tax=Enterococcus TaxID=1350 RepID=UPI001A8F1C22|nr:MULTISPECIES: MerR family transcriptional regulator [Enterococcus]MBO0434190.1 MerR family transcriptional regulator [Enterococcus sp. DIV0849a]MBO0475345.1 MerR family transcriptional regulator [Enterococcus ureasiticus]
MEKRWTIKEIARQVHLSEDTIRYYEKEDLIHPQRGENNYRLYGQNDIARLKYISVMKYAHFSLKEMKEVLNLFDQPVSLECNNRSRELMINKVNDLETMIQHYQLIINSINSLPIPKTYEECESNYEQMKKELAQFTNTIFEDLHP